MKADHTPEIRLLFMVCTTDRSAEKQAQVTQYVTNHPINWNRLYSLADRHRITPFLYRALQQVPNVSAAFLEMLRQYCQTAATDNLLKLHEYHLLDALLTENAIDHIALKGIYLAEHAYPDSSLRITGDIDILIKKEDVFKTIQLLQQHQYALNRKHTLHWQQGEQTMLNELFEVSLFKPFFNNMYFDIDLHWHSLCFNRDYALFDLSLVRSQPTFSAEMAIILIVAHHGVNNIWQHIYYINDLYFSVTKRTINWPWLMEKLRLYGLERVFLAGLYWCRQIWALPLPPAIEELVSSPGVCSLAKAYAKNWEADTSSELSTLVFRQLLFFARAQTQFSKQLKIVGTFMSSRLFRSSTFQVGKRIIYLPKELGFITIFIRAIRSIYRFLPIHR